MGGLPRLGEIQKARLLLDYYYYYHHHHHQTSQALRMKENSKVLKHMFKPWFVCFSPANMGLLDPSTSDGRVIFFLPWEKSTMAGWHWYFYWYFYWYIYRYFIGNFIGIFIGIFLDEIVDIFSVNFTGCLYLSYDVSCWAFQVIIMQMMIR